MTGRIALGCEIYGLKDPRPEDRGLRFRDVAIDCCGQGRIFRLLQSAGPLEFHFQALAACLRSKDCVSR